ncbi:uncharacterized protein FOMMEDRAFT_135905 [Fomitiporia mediterranea MF3/22]|uniref:uncharacterized protein n=1 Tax=Fomitiporia mediterranea (strain MF3/22) TaxID=694068 RepID=UPI0004407805|nr:uncharacterized protein FOMMEDRAFT_135905 [Fomitiporia mediterranea MF3/22]EJD01772.1 hypothetical protein FOMMEDRAFT_135905 [Fomitiporia mediterranea MF3/22]
MYENGSGSGLPGAPDMPQHGYGRSQPESPADRSAPASASPSADASPVIGGPGSTPQSYPGPPPPYVYVQQTGYYQSQQNASPSLPGSSANGSSYAPPPPSSSSSNGQFPPPPQISTFYQQHHYPREAYMNTAPPSSAPAQSQASPNYSTPPLPQQGHDQQRYIDSSRAKTKKRARSSIGSMTNGELSPSDSPVVPNSQAHPNGRANGQGQSNVYAFYGMATPSSSAGSATAAAPPHSSGSVASAPPPSAASSRGVGGGHYAVNGNANGFNQFQLHTPPPSAPPPMTTSSSSSGVTTSSNVSYTSNHPSYPPQSIDSSGVENGTGTHSPPLVLAPIQTKRMSYHEALPSRYTYSSQNTSHANNNYPPPTTAYASVGKGYSE